MKNARGVIIRCFVQFFLKVFFRFNCGFAIFLAGEIISRIKKRWWGGEGKKRSREERNEEKREGSNVASEGGCVRADVDDCCCRVVLGFLLCY